jgi:DNA-binding IclR family transcriptional regulator
MSAYDDKRLEDVWKWAKRQAISQMDLSFGARECWRVLDGFPPGQCYPSHWYIAEKLRKSKSAVRRYLRELKERGYVRIEEQFDDLRRWSPDRGQTSNAYTVLDQADLIARAKQIFQEWEAKQRENG